MSSLMLKPAHLHVFEIGVFVSEGPIANFALEAKLGFYFALFRRRAVVFVIVVPLSFRKTILNSNNK